LDLKFLDFSTILYAFYKSLGQRGKTRRIYFYSSPWQDLNSHRTTLGFSARVLERSNRHKGTLPPREGLADGDGRPDLNKKWHGVPHCSPKTDWWRKWGRSGLLRWLAARQWRHGRRGSGSGAKAGEARPSCVGGSSRVG
jgi:hypothetical protein